MANSCIRFEQRLYHIRYSNRKVLTYPSAMAHTHAVAPTEPLQTPMVILHDPLVHSAHKVVDILLPVAVLPTLNIVLALDIDAALGRRQLEGPQEVGGLLECWAHCQDLMHQILHADDVVRSQCLHRMPTSPGWKLADTNPDK